MIVFEYYAYEGYSLNLRRIGFSIARRLAQEGAKVMISSRKETNVKKAVEELKSEGLQVAGTVCHVGKAEDRKNLFEKVRDIIIIIFFKRNLHSHFYNFFNYRFHN